MFANITCCKRLIGKLSERVCCTTSSSWFKHSSIRVGSSCRVAPIVPDHVPINVARSFVLEIPQHLLSLEPPTLADSA